MTKRTPSAAFRQRATLYELKNPETVKELAQIVEKLGGRIARYERDDQSDSEGIVSFYVDLPDEDSIRRFESRLDRLKFANLLENDDLVYEQHQQGKLEIISRRPIKNADDLAMVYTPGVARICKSIERDPESAFYRTLKGTTIAVVTDGSAVLGLGNVGPLAALPVMEGKAALFKVFGGVNAVPICLETQDIDEIVETITRIAPSFGGINLEDISAPRCFEIEKRLVENLGLPVFHDDQHGTAIVTLAALENATKITQRRLDAVKVVISGAGAAGIAIADLLVDRGVPEIILCDSKGIVSKERTDLNPYKARHAVEQSGSLAEALVGADIFIGVSAPGILTREMVLTMNEWPIVFGLSNPIPEIMPEELEGIKAVVATGRSDYPNQINNVLAFPGVFRGVLNNRIKKITVGMYRAAARALAQFVSQDELDRGRIIPDVFNPRVAEIVADAVAREKHSNRPFTIYTSR